MKSRRVLINLTLIISVLIVSVYGTFSFAQAHEVAASKLSSEQTDSLNRVNIYRQSLNLKPLRWNSDLAKAAEMKLCDEDENNYFDHISPRGKKAWDFINTSGYNYKYAGENLAMDYDDEKGAFDAWVRSPAHLENIVSDKFLDYGFANRYVDINGKKTMMMVQMFGGQVSFYERILSG